MLNDVKLLCNVSAIPLGTRCAHDTTPSKRSWEFFFVVVGDLTKSAIQWTQHSS